jgi:hypothetical protein
MSRSSEFADLVMPWAGLIVGLVALVIAHQFGSDGMFDDCLAVGSGRLLVVSGLAIAATLGGALVSWRVFNSPAQAPARKVIAVISLGSAALFVFAMILPVIAAVLIPPCFQ